mmetsp:Transcript_77056/g.121677  ORF Transcript_77056/g.121677 Transcript_77056/m.121677 type:complete len:350 (-) Transcript_77056:61-1110(-)
MLAQGQVVQVARFVHLPHGLVESMEDSFSRAETTFAVCFYAFCSSVMLVANKVAVTYVAVPGLVVCLQFSAAIIFIYGRSMAFQTATERFTYERVLIFMPYVVSMSLCIFSNVKCLQYANVETVIVFRSCSPLCVSILDWLFLGRELPGRRSALSLVVVALGAVGYVLTDSEFKLNGISAYTWVGIYFVAIVTEMTYGKRVMSRLSFDSPVWGSVLYTNMLCLPPMFAMATWNSETSQLQELINQDQISFAGVVMVLLTCVLGVGISWAGWNCREKVSATAFTLLGVTCKFMTVILNVLIWDKHASVAGLMFLTVCIGAGTLYKQAPMRPKVQVPAKVDMEFGLEDEAA